MKTNYLFPNCFKIYGWIILIPSLIVGALSLVFEIEPTALEFKMPALFVDEFMGQNKLAGTVNNNILNEIVGVLIILSSIFVAFSKEKEEDEYMLKIRPEPLVWAVYVNYGILLISLLFIYDFSFSYVMIFNMFTVIIFFIIRFYWQLNKLKNES
ncbi:MAG: hypothetical protein GWP32_09840 [Bacteroidetes bacterium]|nr:hypothetical protein [Bacteroidota bacterium]